MAQTYFVEEFDGGRCWYRDPEMKILHRVGGPAVECVDGLSEWYHEGFRHRVDGPAVEYPDGLREWLQCGVRHRLGGPALECPDGTRSWYQNGELHRLDGPAVEYSDGRKEYWIEGVRVAARQFPKLAREYTQVKPKEMTMAELEKVLGHAIKIIK